MNMAVASCGGGGGAGDSPQQQPVTIPSDPVDFGNIGDDKAQEISAYMNDVSKAALSLFSGVGNLNSPPPAPGSTLNGLAAAQTALPCSNGGSASIPDDFGAGSYIFTNCNLFGAGAILDGTIIMGGTVTDNFFNGYWQFNNFSLTDKNTTLKLDGRINGTWSMVATTHTGSYSNQGVVKVEYTSSKYSDKLELSTFTMNEMEDTVTSLAQFDYSIVLKSMVTGGQVTATTTQTIFHLSSSRSISSKLATSSIS